MLLFFIAILLTGVVGLYVSGGGVSVFVDNGGKDPIAVIVEGQPEVTVAPGQFEVIKCEPGEKRIQLRCGQQVLFDGVKDLQKPDKTGTNRRYFFNPDNRNRYRTYTIEYGSNPFKELFQPGRKSPSEDALRSAYRELAAEPILLPPDAWFEVPDVHYVLATPPDCVTTKGFSERRAVMTRVDPKDYSFIEAARKNTNPSETDLKALFEVVNRVLQSEP
jgi:hypothetical protein